MQLDFSLPSPRLHALRAGAVWVTDARTIFRVEGNGALTCLQGLLTNDLVTPGNGSLVYGAAQARNFPVVMGTVLFMTAFYLLVVTAADLLIARLDPRVRDVLRA